MTVLGLGSSLLVNYLRIIQIAVNSDIKTGRIGNYVLGNYVLGN